MDDEAPPAAGKAEGAMIQPDAERTADEEQTDQEGRRLQCDQRGQNGRGRQGRRDHEAIHAARFRRRGPAVHCFSGGCHSPLP